MKTASLGRRLGDWLGIVLDDEIAWSVSSPRLGETAETERPRDRLESSRNEPVAQITLPEIATAAPRPGGFRRIAPTQEFYGEVASLHQAVNELRAGLDTDRSDEN